MTFDEIEKEITSPLYPGKHHYDNVTRWTITAPMDQAIILKFKRFDLKEKNRKTQKCDKEYLKVYEGELGNSYSLAKTLCGSKIPNEFESKGNVLRLKFKADYGSEKMGFQILFRNKGDKLVFILLI